MSFDNRPKIGPVDDKQARERWERERPLPLIGPVDDKEARVIPIGLPPELTMISVEEYLRAVSPRRASGASTEWKYLSSRAQELKADLASVKSDADERGLGMEPYSRLRANLDSADLLLQSSPNDRVATVIREELDYVRNALDKHREWMAQEVGHRRREARSEQLAEEERKRHEAMGQHAKSVTRPRGHSGIREFEEDYKRRMGR